MSHETAIAANPASSPISREDTKTVSEAADQQLRDLESRVRQHARVLFKVAFGVLRNSHDAEDVDAGGLAFRLALDRKRKPAELDVAELEIPANTADAEQVAIEGQQVEHLRALIALLPDNLRFPLVLSAVEELNSRQIGEVLGIPESSVRGRIMRARQVLKEKMAALTVPRL